MSRRRTLAACLFASASPFALPLDALAQDNSSEEIVVTAQKREQALQDVPISVGVLDDETLEAVGADGLEDIVRMVPSLAMTNISRGGNQVQIRGLGSNVGNVGTVALYNDGVIAPGRIQSSGTFAEADSAIFDVERVEVLRGPQGTLYGEGSFGGVINIISRRPNTEEIEASLAATYADTEHGESSNEIQAMINVPLLRDQIALRIVAYDYDQGGYIDSIGTGFVDPVNQPFGVLVEEDVNSASITGGRALLTARPNESFDVTLMYKTEETESGALSIASPNVIAFINALALTNFDPNYSQVDYFASSSVSETDQTILEVNADTSLGQLTFISGFGETEQTNDSGVFAEGSAWSNEVRLSSESEGNLDWIVGLYQRTAERQIDFLGTPLFGNELDVWAAFGQVYWNFAPTMTATFGLRYESGETVTDDLLNGLTSEGEFDSVIPKLSLAWEPDEDSLYYVSAAQGFRAGGANVDESIGTDPTYTSQFDPDTIWNYEIGAKRTLADGRLTINAAAFYIDWSDIQIDRPIASLINPPIAFIVVNGEEAHSYGVEADIFWQPTPDWDVVVGGSLINAEYDSGEIFDDGVFAFVPLAGQELPSTPKYLFNASVERRFPVTTALEGYVRGDYSLRGSSYGDVPNDPPPGGDFSSGESQIVNLRTGVRHDIWDLQLFATNVFDEAASTFTFFDGGFVDQQVVLRPRTIGATLRVRYN